MHTAFASKIELTRSTVIALEAHLANTECIVARTGADAVLAAPVWTLSQVDRDKQEDQEQAISKLLQSNSTHNLSASGVRWPGCRHCSKNRYRGPRRTSTRRVRWCSTQDPRIRIARGRRVFGSHVPIKMWELSVSPPPRSFGRSTNTAQSLRLLLGQPGVRCQRAQNRGRTFSERSNRNAGLGPPTDGENHVDESYCNSVQQYYNCREDGVPL